MSERQSEINAPKKAWMSMIWSTWYDHDNRRGCDDDDRSGCDNESGGNEWRSWQRRGNSRSWQQKVTHAQEKKVSEGRQNNRNNAIFGHYLVNLRNRHTKKPVFQMYCLVLTQDKWCEVGVRGLHCKQKEMRESFYVSNFFCILQNITTSLQQVHTHHFHPYLAASWWPLCLTTKTTYITTTHMTSLKYWCSTLLLS